MQPRKKAMRGERDGEGAAEKGRTDGWADQISSVCTGTRGARATMS